MVTPNTCILISFIIVGYLLYRFSVVGHLFCTLGCLAINWCGSLMQTGIVDGCGGRGGMSHLHHK